MFRKTRERPGTYFSTTSSQAVLSVAQFSKSTANPSISGSKAPLDMEDDSQGVMYEAPKVTLSS